MKSLAKVNYRGFTVPVAAGILLWLLAAVRPVGISISGWRLFAMFLVTITVCITKSLPIVGIAIISYVLTLLTSLVKMRFALTAPADSTPWIIVIAYMIARGFVKTGLGRRITLVFVCNFGKKTLGLGYPLSLIDLLIASATLSNIARSGGIALPIIQSLSEILGSKVGDGTEKKIGSHLAYNEFHANTIPSSLFMTASAPNVAAVGLVEANGTHASWLERLFAALVPELIVFLVVPFVIYKMYPPEIKETPNAKQWANHELEKMGKMTIVEKLMLTILVLASALWMVSSFVGLDATLVAFLAVALLLLSGILTTDDLLHEAGVRNVVVWFSILIFMASQLSVHGGVIHWLQLFIKRSIRGINPMLVMAIPVLVYFYTHYFFASGTAYVVTIYAPFLLIVQGEGAPVMFVAIMLGTTGTTYQSTMHYFCGPATALFASDYVKQADWWKVSFVLGLFYLVLYGVTSGIWMKIIDL